MSKIVKLPTTARFFFKSDKNPVSAADTAAADGDVALPPSCRRRRAKPGVLSSDDVSGGAVRQFEVIN